MITTLATHTSRLLLFRGNPADLPYQPQLTGICAGVAILLNYAILRMLIPGNLAVVFSVFGLLTLAGFTWVVLKWAGKEARYPQTLLALVLISAAFSALSLLPAVWMMPSAQGQQSPPALASLISRILTFWNLGVMAHIFRHALDTSLGRGIFITLLYFILMGVLFYAMFLTGG